VKIRFQGIKAVKRSQAHSHILKDHSQSNFGVRNGNYHKKRHPLRDRNRQVAEYLGDIRYQRKEHSLDPRID
ncbi:unnamed protein product, partial [Acidithrix sp. C25]